MRERGACTGKRAGLDTAEQASLRTGDCETGGSRTNAARTHPISRSRRLSRCRPRPEMADRCKQPVRANYRQAHARILYLAAPRPLGARSKLMVVGVSEDADPRLLDHYFPARTQAVS